MGNKEYLVKNQIKQTYAVKKVATCKIKQQMCL